MTSVGHRAEEAFTSLRAGIVRLQEYPAYEPLVRDPALFFPESVVASPVTELTDGLEGVERLLALATPALKEAIFDAKLSETDIGSTSLLVAGSQMPSRIPGTRIATVLVPRLAQRVARIPFAGKQYYCVGSAGCFEALHRARRLLNAGTCRYCIVGGVDSWLDPETLAWLDEARRLKSDSTIDGFIPGEAAAFVVVEREEQCRARKKLPYAVCGGVALDEEKNTIWTDQPCTGEGLARCLKTVLADPIGRSRGPDVVVCDLNGESYRASEWAYAVPKAFQEVKVPPLVHPADCIGDVGAASGGVLLGLAAWSSKKDPAEWRTALAWCSSDDGLRGACVIEALGTSHADPHGR